MSTTWIHSKSEHGANCVGAQYCESYGLLLSVLFYVISCTIKCLKSGEDLTFVVFFSKRNNCKLSLGVASYICYMQNERACRLNCKMILKHNP